LLNEEIIILESAGMSLDQHQELKQRTKAFALRIIRMTQACRATAKQTLSADKYFVLPRV
jgi:hypothetical protein